MRARLTMIAGLLVIGTAASAEPQKVSPVRPAPQPTKIVLASADTVRAPTPALAKTSTASAKRRAGRVTTCRCGDPASNPDSQNQ